MAVFSEYVEASMHRAVFEVLEDGRLFATIPGIPGVWADGEIESEVRCALQEVLEEWLVIGLRNDERIPVIGGISLNFPRKKWRKLSPAASSSRSSGP